MEWSGTFPLLWFKGGKSQFFVFNLSNIAPNENMWHFIEKGPIRSKLSYCQEKVVLAISKHLRPILSQTVENSLRNRHLNLKNEKSKNLEMLWNRNFNIFFSRKKSISSSCMWISGYDIVYNSSASNQQQRCARKYVCNPNRLQLENEKDLKETTHLVILEKKFVTV